MRRAPRPVRFFTAFSGYAIYCISDDARIADAQRISAPEIRCNRQTQEAVVDHAKYSECISALRKEDSYDRIIPI
jgi:hypothetical protein